MKPSFTISLFFTLTLLVGCVGNAVPEKVEAPERIFEFPKLEGNTGNGVYIDTSEQLESISYVYQNTSTTKTTIQLFDLRYYNDSFRLIPDSLPFSLTNNVELHVDYSQEFTIKYEDNYIPFPSGTDEFGNVIPKYHSTYDSIKIFPAYIVNYTDSLQGIENHDGRIIMIQEALNPQNEWRPVEYFSYSGCGNSFGITSLDTNCYIMFGVNKYKGDFKTKLRVRLRTNGNTIISNEYSGYINKSQFKEREDESIFNSYLKGIGGY
jgi:hypothetical protein